MQIQASVAALSLALAAFVAEASVTVTVYNQCSESIELYDNSAIETVAPGGSTSRTLVEGYNGMFRNGISAQATLAEFSLTGGFFWYDISCIPTGSVGPGYCSSLAECKAVTGGTGYNTPMQIAPSGCTTVTCLEDGCADAYQYPKDDTKTHACADTTSVDLTFCPGGSGGSSTPIDSPKQQQSTTAPTTAAPWTAPPTTQPPTQAPTQPPTQAPTQPPTQAPTQPPTQAPTTPPPTEAPTTQPPTQAPTTQPPTEAPTTQPPTEAPTTQPPTEAPTTQPPTEAPTETLTPTPTETPTTTPEVMYAASNSTSGDEEQEAAKATKSGTTTSAKAPVAQVVSAPSTSTSKDDGTQTANTQSSTEDDTSLGTYFATGLGCCAVVAAVAVVAIARKKKQEMDATEEKEYSQQDLMTPVTQINVL